MSDIFARVARSFKRGFATYDESAIVQRLIARGLVRRLTRHAGQRPFARVLEAGYGTGHLTRELQRLQIDKLWLNDLAAGPVPFLTPSGYLPGDITSVSLPEGLDLIASASMIQWIESPRLLIEAICAKAVRGGWLVLSGFSPEHFPELQAIGSHAGAPSYMSSEAMAALLPEGWKVHERGSRSCTLWFDTPLHVLQHLRATGVNGRASRQWSRGALQHFCTAYQDRFGAGARVPLTYGPTWLIAERS